MADLTKEMFSKFENIDHLIKFLHDCVNGLHIDNASQGPILSESMGEQQFDAARKSIQNFYRRRALQEDFPLPNELPKNVVTAIETVFRIRYSDIVSLLVKERLINSGHNLLENFDWKLKWLLGSSKLATIREPICQIELCCINLDGDLKPCKNFFNFECNLEKLDELISVLSRVKDDLGGHC